MAKDPLPRLRKICLKLPNSTEKLSHGEPTFFVRDKVFAMFSNNHHNDGRIAVWCKAPMGFQEALVGSNPERFFVPPYVGHRGWVGLRLESDRVDWDEVAAIIEESYRMTVTPPKALPAKT